MNSFFPSVSIRVIRGESEFSWRTVILKLRLQNWPCCAVYKTPVFDSAAGGFVYVDGGPQLKKQRSATLSLFELGRNIGRIGSKKCTSLCIYGAEVKVLDLFLGKRGFF
jgi:hypothetical protein